MNREVARQVGFRGRAEQRGRQSMALKWRKTQTTHNKVVMLQMVRECILITLKERRAANGLRPATRTQLHKAEQEADKIRSERSRIVNERIR